MGNLIDKSCVVAFGLFFTLGDFLCRFISVALCLVVYERFREVEASGWGIWRNNRHSAQMENAAKRNCNFAQRTVTGCE